MKCVPLHVLRFKLAPKLQRLRQSPLAFQDKPSASLKGSPVPVHCRCLTPSHVGSLNVIWENMIAYDGNIFSVKERKKKEDLLEFVVRLRRTLTKL